MYRNAKMPKREDAVVVFTARSPERLVREGGSQAWVLNPSRAKRCDWLVCTQNRHNPDYDFSDATEPHGSGFLLGKISSVRPSAEDHEGGRWIIEISEFARIDYPNLWDHGRNPVRYSSLEELGITLEGIDLKPVTQPNRGVEEASAQAAPSGLTIPEAKKALAATLGVRPEAIEITIRA
jgi:hypothetical protein